MSLSGYKITDEQIAQKGVIAAPDKMTGSAAQNKAVFDRLIREAVKGAVNGLIDALEGFGVEFAVQFEEGEGKVAYIRLGADGGLEVSADGEEWISASGVTSFNGRSGVVVPQSGDYDAEDVGAIAASEKGAAGGVATLGSDGKVPTTQLPEMPGAGYTKDETLTQATAGRFPLNLPAGQEAVPNNVFDWLGDYNDYWYRTRTKTAVYKGIKSNVTADTYVVRQLSSNSHTFKYSHSVVRIQPVMGVARIVMTDPITLTQTVEEAAAYIAANAPIYVNLDAGVSPSAGDNPIYFPAGTTAGSSAATVKHTVKYVSTAMSSEKYSLYAAVSVSTSSPKAQTLSFEFSHYEYGDWVIGHGASYPGVLAGQEIQRLGKPFDRLPFAAKIETGSYYGMGTYGEDNPNTLALSFEPKLVIIDEASGDGAIPQVLRFLFNAALLSTDYRANAYTSTAFTSPASTSYAKLQGGAELKTLVWYDTASAAAQANAAETEYRYLAIG